MLCGILGPAGCGGSFLDWSLHYLSGQTKSLVVECNEFKRSKVKGKTIRTIVDNPIRKNTAHLHIKSHPDTNSLNEVIELYANNPCPLGTFFYVDSMLPEQSQTYHNNIVRQYPDVKFITYAFKPQHIDWIFYFQYEKILLCKQKLKREMLIQRAEDTMKITSSMSVNERREWISFYYPECIKGQILNEQIIATNNNYLLDFDRVFTDMPLAITEIFEFLGLQIDKGRYDHWADVYNQWLEKNSIKFFIDLPLIVKCIVQGKPLSLSGYSMSFSKEVILASKLFYDHNLVLKFKGVDDLSTDTMQWHYILEPNIYHQFPD